MPDYKNGKIYKLWSLEGDDIYIGSTTVGLHKRLNNHKKPSNICRSKLLFEKYKEVKIELIEEYACENKAQLNRREGEIIRLNKEFIVNLRIAGRTRKESSKAYYDANLEGKKKLHSAYREANRDKINEKERARYNANLEKQRERGRAKYEANKDKINEKKRAKCAKKNKSI